MEPGLTDRDHRLPARGATPSCRSRNGARSYRPGSPGLAALAPADEDAAAMEPGLTDRDHRSSCRGSGRRRSRRNGARSYRPGSPLQNLKDLRRLATPQWSPVLPTGITRSGTHWSPAVASRNGARSYRPGSLGGRAHVQPQCFAAMEPGLTDRDHSPSCRHPRRHGPRPQWSPVLPTGITEAICRSF